MKGEVPWPTSLETVDNPNKTYKGEPVISPSGEVIDSVANYGVGRTVDYIIRDQGGNLMSTGVLFKEEVSPGNKQAEALVRMGVVDVNSEPQRPIDGIVPDTLGVISRDPKAVPFLQRNQINAVFKQTVTVLGTYGNEYRTALILKNEYQTTNSGVTITRGAVEKRARPK